MRHGGLVFASAAAVLALVGGGCDEQPSGKTADPAPVTTPATPESSPPNGTPATGLPAPAAPEASSTPSLASPGSATPPAPAKTPGPRDLDAILFELEEIEGTGVNLHDPEADHEARYERVEDIAVEAAGFGLEILPLVVKRLVEARQLPKEVGYLQRAGFLAHVFARLAASDAPTALEETAKLLGTLELRELESACSQLPRGRRDAVLAGWLGQLSSPPGPREGALRLALLKRYAADAKTLDSALLKTLAKDPDAKVAAAANELSAR